eukprot:2774021-Pyramimonas_sp.AAC.1
MTPLARDIRIRIVTHNIRKMRARGRASRGGGRLRRAAVQAPPLGFTLSCPKGAPSAPRHSQR